MFHIKALLPSRHSMTRVGMEASVTTHELKLKSWLCSALRIETIEFTFRGFVSTLIASGLTIYCRDSNSGGSDTGSPQAKGFGMKDTM